MSSRIKGAPLNSVITFLSFVDTNMLIPVIALYAASLGATVGVIGILVGIYSITNFLMNIFAGRWVDRFGFRKPMVIGLLGDVIAMLCYSLCKLPWHLALTRAFHGSSGGLTGPATMSATGSYARSSGKAKAMSYYGIAIAAATLIGHGAGGTLVTYLGYNFLFYLGAGFLCIGVVLAFLLPAGSTDTNNNISKPMRAHCKDLLSLFSRGDLSVSYLAIFAQFFSFGGVVALLPLHVTSLGMEAVHVGMLLIIFSVMFIIVQFPAGNISDKKGRLRPTAFGLILILIALVLIPFSNSFATLGIALAIYGTGYGILFPAISALLLDEATGEEYGKVTGLFHALITAGVAVGAPVIGWIAAAGNIKIGLAMTPVAIVAALVLTLIRLNMKRDNYRSQ